MPGEVRVLVVHGPKCFDERDVGVIGSHFAAHLSEGDAELLADVLSRVVLAPAE